MGCEQNTFECIFSEFLAARSQEEMLLNRLALLLDEPVHKSTVPDRIATVYAEAKLAYGSDAIRFLTQPHPLLAGEIPLHLAAQDEAGAQRVRQILGRILGGTYA